MTARVFFAYNIAPILLPSFDTATIPVRRSRVVDDDSNNSYRPSGGGIEGSVSASFVPLAKVTRQHHRQQQQELQLEQQHQEDQGIDGFSDSPGRNKRRLAKGWRRLLFDSNQGFLFASFCSLRKNNNDNNATTNATTMTDELSKIETSHRRLPNDSIENDDDEYGGIDAFDDEHGSTLRTAATTSRKGFCGVCADLLSDLWNSSGLVLNHKLNLLLFAGPLALLGDAMGMLGETACFALSGIALIPCAERCVHGIFESTRVWRSQYCGCGIFLIHHRFCLSLYEL